MAMKAIPRPPSQFSIPRQRFVPAGRWSSPTITVEPVVVMPETASNIASVKVRSGSPRINGRLPKAGSANQIAAVSTKACRMPSCFVGALAQASATAPPVNMVSIAA